MPAEEVVDLIKVMMVQGNLLHFRILIVENFIICPMHALPRIKALCISSHNAHLNDMIQQ